MLRQENNNHLDVDLKNEIEAFVKEQEIIAENKLINEIEFKFFLAAKNNDIIAIENFYDWSFIKQHDDLRKKLINTVIDNKAINILHILIDNQIFTHADYEEYTHSNNMMNNIATLIRSMEIIDTPNELNNLITEHVKVVKPNSYLFTVELFSYYAQHIIKKSAVDHFKKVFNDSRICLTEDDQIEFVRHVQRACSSVKEYHYNKRNNRSESEIESDQPEIGSNLKFIYGLYSLKQIVDIICSDIRIPLTEKQKEEVNRLNNYVMTIDDSINKALDKLNVLHRYINELKVINTNFALYHFGSNYIKNMCELHNTLFKKIDVNIQKTDNVVDKISCSFHLLNTEYMKGNDQHLEFILMKFVYSGICRVESLGHNNKQKTFHFTDAFNIFMKLYNEKQHQQLHQVELKKPQNKM